MVGRGSIVRFLGTFVSGMAVFLLLATAAGAATVTWDGGAGTGDWDTAANWTGDLAPTSADVVVIGPGAQVLLASGTRTVRTLQLDGSLTIGGRLYATTDWTTIGATGSLTSSTGFDAPFLRNEGLLTITAGTLDVDNDLTNSGTMFVTGRVYTGDFVDSGVSTVTSTIQVATAALSGTHSFCTMQTGTWVQSAGTVTIPKLCASAVGSYELAPGARLRVSVHSQLGTPPPAYQHPAPLTANVATLDGTIEVGGAWGSDLTTEARSGTLVKATASSGAPTLDVPAVVADGPDPWVLSATTRLAPSVVRFSIHETVPPTAPSNLQRLVGGSVIHASWDAATDDLSAIAGYSYEVSTSPTTVPDADADESVREIWVNPGPGDWYLHVRAVDAAGNAGPTIHSPAWTVHEAGNWTGGGTTNDWHDGANWESGQVPAAGADVTIIAPDLETPTGPVITAADVEAGLLDLRAPLTLDPGRRLTAAELVMVGPADLRGGTVDAGSLEARFVSPAPQMTSALTGLQQVHAESADLTLDGSVGAGGIVVDGSSVTVTGALAGGPISVGVGSELQAASVTAGTNDVILDGRLVTGTLSVAGDLSLSAEASLTATTTTTTGTGNVWIVPGAIVQTDLDFDGASLTTQSAIEGDVHVRGGRVFIDVDAPDVAISGSFTVDGDATMEYNDPDRGRFSVGGAARVDGTIVAYDAQATTAWGVIEPLVAAAGGMSGTPTLLTFSPTPRVRLAMTATVLGLTPIDRIEPAPPTLAGTLGAAEADGRRALTASWSYDGTVVEAIEGHQAPIDGWSIVVDSAAATVPDTTADHAGGVTTAQSLVGPGTWYVHLRAHDAEGNWGVTAHAGPFTVDAPPGTTPPAPEPIDRCSNIPGVQETLPARTVARADGTCATTATALADLIWGTVRAEVFRAGRGNDLVRAGGGADRLFGEAGNDRLFGDGGDDRLNGGPGRDQLSGGPGRDTLDARDRSRADVVSCGGGRDVVYADRGDRVARDCERVVRR